MQTNLAVLPALSFAGLAVAQDGRPDPRDAKAKAPPVHAGHKSQPGKPK